jgi:hypothetical protein
MFAMLVCFDSVKGEQKRKLRSLFERSEGSQIIEWSDESVYLVRLNVGALTDYSGVMEHGDNGVSVLAGQTLIEGGDDTEIGHRILYDALRKNDVSKLSTVSGTFCCAVYEKSESGNGGCVTLVTDKIGIRPIYIYRGNECYLISSALNIIERFLDGDLSPDFVGITQRVALGYPLGERTEYLEVDSVRSAAIVKITRDGINKSTYFDWGSITANNLSVEENARIAYELFSKAVARRASGDKVVAASLSGGLDSRCVVGALRASGRQVVCLNWADPKAKNYVYAEMLAKRLSCHFFPIPKGDGRWFRKYLASYLREFNADSGIQLDRPRVLWSGDGGSVGAGAVYLDEEMLTAARTRGDRYGVESLIGHYGRLITKKIFSRDYRSQVHSVYLDSLMTEMQSITCDDRGNALFLFFLLNDQRRHMEDIYENIDLWKIDYNMPFFDGDFCGHLFSVPIDQRLRHVFYNEWLKFFPDPVHKTPWQVYPGHEGHDMVLDDERELLDQWGTKPTSTLNIDVVSRVRKLYEVMSRQPRSSPISKSRILFWGMFHVLGLRDYGRLFKISDTYNRYYR